MPLDTATVSKYGLSVEGEEGGGWEWFGRSMLMVVAGERNCRPWGKIDSPFRTRYYRSEIFLQVDKTSGAMKGRRESPNTHTRALTGKKREIQVKEWGKFCVSSNNTRAIRRTHWNFQARRTWRTVFRFRLQALKGRVFFSFRKFVDSILYGFLPLFQIKWTSVLIGCLQQRIWFVIHNNLTRNSQ